MHTLAALDLVTGRIHHRIRQRRRWRGLLGLPKTPRCRRPGEKPYVALDDFSPHKHAEVRSRIADNGVELVLLPTYGSWPNRIEPEFTALRCFALNGTGHRTHGDRNAATAACIRRRNAHAEPRTGFAPDSPVRAWTRYPTKVTRGGFHRPSGGRGPRLDGLDDPRRPTLEGRRIDTAVPIRLPQPNEPTFQFTAADRLVGQRGAVQLRFPRLQHPASRSRVCGDAASRRIDDGERHP
ncbi:hypothetical protein [Streptomyces radiopugnans]|uniref:hypothetical protein n=1 Tax=Streptomyces radiopugnans TaxID=403935 RepID=UPI003F1A2DEE